MHTSTKQAATPWLAAICMDMSSTKVLKTSPRATKSVSELISTSTPSLQGANGLSHSVADGVSWSLRAACGRVQHCPAARACRLAACGSWCRTMLYRPGSSNEFQSRLWAPEQTGTRQMGSAPDVVRSWRASQARQQHSASKHNSSLQCRSPPGPSMDVGLQQTLAGNAAGLLVSAGQALLAQQLHRHRGDEVDIPEGSARPRERSLMQAQCRSV